MLMPCTAAARRRNLAGTPGAIVDTIVAGIRELVAGDELGKRISDLGGVPHATTPAGFARSIEADRLRYGKIIEERAIASD